MSNSAPKESTTESVSGEGSPSSNPELDLARLLVRILNLEINAADIDPTAPLYGSGLGLDSIDILEVALAISKTYGVRLRSDDEKNRKVFNSLQTLNAYIQEHRTK